MKRAMYWLRFGAAVVIAIASVVVALIPGNAYAAWSTVERASEGTGGIQGNGASDSPAFSWDGRYVAFSSSASNLVTDDANGVPDIFIRDRTSGVTTRASLGQGGVEANAPSSAPAISGDGRYVAFMSDATNLVAGDANGFSDVFLRDMTTGVTERVSTSTAGDSGNLPAGAPSVSWDGRFVAFYSLASNLVTGDTNGWWDVFVKDRQNGYTDRVSIATGGGEGDDMSYEPAISFDGRYVAFTSRATNLVAGDGNSTDDIFFRDRIAATTERISVSTVGGDADGPSVYPSISHDGRYVAFESFGTDLVAGDTNGTRDVFVRDRSLATSERVSLADDGSQAEGAAVRGALSSDGNRIAFTSAGSVIVPGDTNLVPDAFVRDRAGSSTSRASIAGAVQIDSAPAGAVIAGDGRASAFATGGGFPGAIADTNGVSDVYVSTSGEPALTATPSPASLPELTPGPPPAAPSGLTATPSSDSSINLTWTDNSADETLFKIERRMGLGPFAGVADVAAGVTSFGDTGLTPGTGYTYRVRAANPDARSSYTNEATATTFPAVPPDAPSNLTATAVTGVQIDLTWSDNATGETGYKIERKTGADSYAEVASLPANSISHSDSGLTPMTTYWYRAKATGFAGDSGYSNETSATTLADVPPAPPSQLEVLTTTADQAHLSWTDVSGNETGFEIERRAPGGTFVSAGSAGPDVTIFIDAGLDPATPYEFRVRAVNTGGPSQWATASGSTKPAPVCKRPRVLFSSTRTGNSQIYSVDHNGAGLARISSTVFNETRPVFVPGSDRIVYVSDEFGAPEIMAMNLDGTNRTRLTADPATDINPVVSPDGAVIAFESDRSGSAQIWLMDANGANQTQITAHAGGAYSPAFAPDSMQLAFHGFDSGTGTFQVFVSTYSVSPYAGGVPARINPADTSNQVQPTWSPDGSKIAFVSDIDGQVDVYSRTTTGSEQTRITTDTAVEAKPWYAYDSARVLVSGFASGDPEIYSIGPGATERLTTDTAVDTDPSDAVASPWAVAPSSSFMAEGASTGGFETWVLLSNPGGAPVTACVTYLTGSGLVPGPVVSVPAGSRRSERVGATVSTFDVSTVVEGIDGVVLAERAVYSSRPDTAGAHVGRSVESPAFAWYAAEGSTAGGFETWALVANPSRTKSATVSINFMTPGGARAGPQSVPLGPGVRSSFRVSSYVPNEFDVSTEVTSTGAPVLAERASYVNSSLKGATVSPSTTTPSARWFLAEGAASGNFETWILVSNPQSTSVTVDVDYLTPGGRREGPAAEALPPKSRRSYRVKDSGFVTYDVSTEVSATAGVIAERAMYVDDPVLGRGGATGEGVPEAGTDWLAVEGAADGGFTTWVLIANPGTSPACVNVNYLTGTGSVPLGLNPLCLAPETRRSVRVNDTVTTFDVSTRVTSTTGSDSSGGAPVTATTIEPVVVERAIYTPAGPSRDSTAGPAIRLS